MNEDWKKAINKLKDGGFTCVSVKNGEIFSSTARGIKPIVYNLRENQSFFEGASVADKVIGKAAAMLFAYGKVKSVYAAVISEPALDVLKQYNIETEYGEKVALIRNRDNTGMCPMETRALGIDSLQQAYYVFNEIVK